MKERDISRYLNARVKELGGSVRRVTWQGRRGAPDKLVLLEGHHFWVEEKRPGKEATKAQAREHKRMRDAGMEIRVISTPYDVEAMLSCMPYDYDDYDE